MNINLTEQQYNVIIHALMEQKAKDVIDVILHLNSQKPTDNPVTKS